MKNIKIRSFYEFIMDSNCVAPTPFVKSESELYIYFGRQKESSIRAKLMQCTFEFDGKEFKMANEIAINFSEENLNNLGERGVIPTFAHKIRGNIGLWCAGFTSPDLNQKHKLLMFKILVKPENLGETCELLWLPDFDFVRSQGFHTFASASENVPNEVLFASGKDWFTDGNHRTPVTEIYSWKNNRISPHSYFNNSTHKSIAITRPNFVEIPSGEKIWAISKRMSGQNYFSEMYVENVRKNENQSNIEFELILSFRKLDILNGMDITYLSLFIWRDSLWGIGTSSYRGEKGFHLFEFVIN